MNDRVKTEAEVGWLRQPESRIVTTTSTDVASYWIDPDGGAHEVGLGIQRTHHRWIMRHRGFTVDVAEDDGGHRVVVVPLEGELFTYGRVPLTVRQQEEVTRLATRHGTPNVRIWVRGHP